MTISARLTSKGQITLPAELRRSLGLKPGGTVDFRKTEGGDYQLVAKRYTLADLRGMIRTDIVLSDDELAEALSESWGRTSGRAGNGG